MDRFAARALLLLGALTPACGPSPDAATAEPEPPVDPTTVPRYTELFEAYFAPGTPGHCATAGCHADPGHAVWRCGPAPSDCFAGMAELGLLDSAQPARSALVDPHTSPVVWINPSGGNMPLDAQVANAEAARALTAWARAGARND